MGGDWEVVEVGVGDGDGVGVGGGGDFAVVDVSAAMSRRGRGGGGSLVCSIVCPIFRFPRSHETAQNCGLAPVGGTVDRCRVRVRGGTNEHVEVMVPGWFRGARDSSEASNSITKIT